MYVSLFLLYVSVFLPCVRVSFCASAMCVSVGISVCLFPVFLFFIFEVFCFLCEDMCRPFYALGLEFLTSRFACGRVGCLISCLVGDVMFWICWHVAEF